MGSVAAVVGGVLLLVATFVHPAPPDPNDLPVAFEAYAADPFWVWSHLGEFVGFTLLALALVALESTMEAGRAAALAKLSEVGAIVMIAMAAALQAVDGVALKMMVDRWAAAPQPDRAIVYEAAVAVRHVEIGLASYLSLTSALTVILIGAAILFSRRYPNWFRVTAILAALATGALGLAQALSGFSPLAMTLSAVGPAVLLLWALAAGVLMWRVTPELVEQS